MDKDTGATPETSQDEGQAIDDIDAILDADYDRIQAGEERQEETEDGEESEDTSNDQEDDQEGESDSETGQSDEEEETSDKEEDEGKEETEDDDSEDGESATATAPDSWTPDAKAKFKEADPLIQQEILKREADFQNGHAKSEDARQLATQFKETMAPYEAIIKSEGGTNMGAVSDMMNIAYILRRGTSEAKTQLLLSTAKRFNVDLGPVEQGEDDEDVDPEIADLRKEINSLKNINQDQSTQDQQNRNSEALRLINEFIDAKDDKGNSVNPHYDAVRETMAALINSGRVGSIKEAYDQAVWSDPTVRELMQKAERKDVGKTKLAETKKKAKAAKKAAGTQVKTDGGNVAPSAKDWDEDLNAKYDEIAGR